MTTVTVIKEVLEKLKRQAGLAAQLSDTADILNDVGLDSLELLQFMLELEARLGVRIDFDRLEFAELSSIARLAGFLDGMPARAAS